MTTYFNIIISADKFFMELKPIIETCSVQVFIEKFNENRGFYYEYFDVKKSNFCNLIDKEYRGFFFTLLNPTIQDGKLVLNKKNQNNSLSFYNEALFNCSIEGKGGREDIGNLECIKLRMISKMPDKQIEKFYKSLQTLFKKAINIKKGLNIGQHFDKKIYYFETNKNMLNDFSNKELKYFE